MGHSVLVVDDNPIIRDSAMLTIERINEKLDDEQHLTLFEAGDGATAWDRLTDHSIDLLIVDLYIPILSGLEIIERARKTDTLESLKILAISASIEDARARALAHGADRFLQKPVRLADFVDAITALLHLDIS